MRKNITDSRATYTEEVCHLTSIVGARVVITESVFVEWNSLEEREIITSDATPVIKPSTCVLLTCLPTHCVYSFTLTLRRSIYKYQR